MYTCVKCKCFADIYVIVKKYLQCSKSFSIKNKADWLWLVFVHIFRPSHCWQTGANCFLPHGGARWTWGHRDLLGSPSSPRCCSWRGSRALMSGARASPAWPAGWRPRVASSSCTACCPDAWTPVEEWREQTDMRSTALRVVESETEGIMAERQEETLRRVVTVVRRQNTVFLFQH